MERTPDGAVTVTPFSMVKSVVEALFENVLVPEPENSTSLKSVVGKSMAPAMVCVVPSKRIVALLSVKLPEFE